MQLNVNIDLTAIRAIFFLVLFAASFVRANCPNGMKIRYSWTDLPPEEKTRFKNAHRRLHEISDRVDYLAEKHDINSEIWHWNAYFFPIHREFIREYEYYLEQVDPDIIMPYWDWSYDAARPWNSDIWNYFSRDGTNCVTDGTLGNKPAAHSPWQGCLYRNISANGPSAGYFADGFVLGQMERDNTRFYAWASAMEAGPHATGHEAIGGIVQTYFAPYDPLFWMHHIYLDKLWDDWQRTHPGAINDFYGPQNYWDGPNSPSNQATASDRIPGFSRSVNQVLDILDDCYFYAPTGSNYIGKYWYPSQDAGSQRVAVNSTRSAAEQPGQRSLRSIPKRSNSTDSSGSFNSVNSSLPTIHENSLEQTRQAVTTKELKVNQITSQQSKGGETDAVNEVPKLQVRFAPMPLGQPLSDVSEEFRKKTKMPEESHRHAREEVKKAFDESRQKIDQGEAVFVNGIQEPQKIGKVIDEQVESEGNSLAQTVRSVVFENDQREFDPVNSRKTGSQPTKFNSGSSLLEVNLPSLALSSIVALMTYLM